MYSLKIFTIVNTNKETTTNASDRNKYWVASIYMHLKYDVLTQVK